MMCNELCMTMYILSTVMYLFLECFHNISLNNLELSLCGPKDKTKVKIIFKH